MAATVSKRPRILLPTLGLLLCACALLSLMGLWIHSHSTCDVIFAQKEWQQNNHHYCDYIKVSPEYGRLLLSRLGEARPLSTTDWLDQELAKSLRTRIDSRWRFSHGRWRTEPSRHDALGRSSVWGRFAYWMGFAYVPASPPTEGFEMTIPFWFMVTIAFVPAALLIRLISARIRNSRRLTSNLCPTCSYDLRAHLGGGAGPKCPECGTPIRSSHGTPAPPPASNPP